ncbi:hypothetical protein BU24DRAFT_448473 [Aaosphaeria arxii CBS 175.79]|uniref:Lytic polysaccharide monooxygenase n=1 Tax=Aaosphaeria arxii CBS 175.79 TaxID=1450172 RepID=A0A6A5Y5L1_9PLEO|nr:uncharacterized protein BU24DRAFT_448473 [Aaosphaeria arxii CBS 175.79]KAF2020131.1 hypothetical protein BU24DRAFT_448473 [Aaosphaeria arxii CBS 175.79]
MKAAAILALSFAGATYAHVAAWAPGMYCKGGTVAGEENRNTNDAVNPLYMLKKEDWWFQNSRGCNDVPPPAGEKLQIPANGEFTVELAHNRAFTTLSYDGEFATAWPDGKEHPEDWNGWNNGGEPAICLPDDGALHAWNETHAAGTAFAISYAEKYEEVTMDNLVVFSTLYHTPWKREATYKVPNLKKCPAGGCTCAWLWIPTGCGQGNMYMERFDCEVINAKDDALDLAKAQAPVYCEDDQSKCVKGAKQMLAWHQETGDNIVAPNGLTPNYNAKCGFANGAQTDIFVEGTAKPTETYPVTPVVVASSTSSYVEPTAVLSVPTGGEPASALPTTAYGEFPTEGISTASLETPSSLASAAPTTAYGEFPTASTSVVLSTPSSLASAAPTTAYGEFPTEVVSTASLETPSSLASAAPTTAYGEFPTEGISTASLETPSSLASAAPTTAYGEFPTASTSVVLSTPSSLASAAPTTAYGEFPTGGMTTIVVPSSSSSAPSPVLPTEASSSTSSPAYPTTTVDPIAPTPIAPEASEAPSATPSPVKPAPPSCVVRRQTRAEKMASAGRVL